MCGKSQTAIYSIYAIAAAQVRSTWEKKYTFKSYTTKALIDPMTSLIYLVDAHKKTHNQIHMWFRDTNIKGSNKVPKMLLAPLEQPSKHFAVNEVQNLWLKRCKLVIRCTSKVKWSLDSHITSPWDLRLSIVY